MEKEIKETREGTYSITNNQPIIPKIYLPIEDKEGKELLVKIIDKYIEK